jgi:hypothetical protein
MCPHRAELPLTWRFLIAFVTERPLFFTFSSTLAPRAGIKRIRGRKAKQLKLAG